MASISVRNESHGGSCNAEVLLTLPGMQIIQMKTEIVMDL